MDPEQILKGRFIQRVLETEAKEMEKGIVHVMSSNAFQNKNWNNISFNVSNTTLTYSHLKKHRFVNMKRVRRNGREIKKKHYPVHNQIVFGHYYFILRQLRYGFSEAIRMELMKITT